MPLSSLRAVAHLVINAGLLDAVERLESRRPGILRVLAYHRVAATVPASDCMDPSLISATPEAFATQMTYLAATCHLLTAEEALAALSNGYRLPPRSVLVTFDDAYRDFLDHAWPAMQRLAIPVVLFTPTDYLDTGRPFWWDRLFAAFRETRSASVSWDGSEPFPLDTSKERHEAFEAAKRNVKRLEHHRAMRWVDRLCADLGAPEASCRSQLNWDEVENLGRAGAVVAPHTRTHPVLTRVTPAEARAEIAGSLADLRQHLGLASPLFAYPCGAASDLCPGVTRIVREVGIQAAVTTLQGHNRRGADRFALRRALVAPHLSLDEFRLTLTGCYSAYAACHRAQWRH